MQLLSCSDASTRDAVLMARRIERFCQPRRNGRHVAAEKTALMENQRFVGAVARPAEEAQCISSGEKVGKFRRA
jgi:hypothetical protein